MGGALWESQRPVICIPFFHVHHARLPRTSSPPLSSHRPARSRFLILFVSAALWCASCVRVVSCVRVSHRFGPSTASALDAKCVDLVLYPSMGGGLLIVFHTHRRHGSTPRHLDTSDMIVIIIVAIDSSGIIGDDEI